jgi:hypothetical protein
MFSKDLNPMFCILAVPHVLLLGHNTIHDVSTQPHLDPAIPDKLLQEDYPYLPNYWATFAWKYKETSTMIYCSGSEGFIGLHVRQYANLFHISSLAVSKMTLPCHFLPLPGGVTSATIFSCGVAVSS